MINIFLSKQRRHIRSIAYETKKLLTASFPTLFVWVEHNYGCEYTVRCSVVVRDKLFKDFGRASHYPTPEVMATDIMRNLNRNIENHVKCLKELPDQKETYLKLTGYLNGDDNV